MNAGYTVGDRVIVCDGVRRCLYGATKQMIELIGKEAEITDIGFSTGHNAVYYRISLGSPGLNGVITVSFGRQRSLAHHRR